MKNYLKDMLIENDIELMNSECYDCFKSKKTILHVRDFFCAKGKVLLEDIDNQVYIANVPAGTFNKNYAVVILKLNKGKLYVFATAQEGLLNQHTCDKAIAKIRKEFSDGE